jgi:hypothetical protein
MNLRNLIYQNLHFQKSESENDLKTARLRQLEVEAKAQERDAKASLATIDFIFDSEGKPELKRDAMTRLGRDTAPNQQLELMPDAGVGNAGKPEDEKEFNLRIVALKHWMISKGLAPDDHKTIKIKQCMLIKHYTKKMVYEELCRFDNAFLMAESTFNDFWQKQQLLKCK